MTLGGISGQELAGRAYAQAQNLAPPDAWLFHLPCRGAIPVNISAETLSADAEVRFVAS
jgi:hypothetical protein